MSTAATASAASTAPAKRMGLTFTETMKGFWTKGAADFKAGYDQGKKAKTPFQFVLTITSDDLDAMLSSPEHRARMSGTVTAPALSPQPLTVEDGIFNLFTVDPGRPSTRNMVYRMTMTAADGRRYFMHGKKIVEDGPITRSWPETTTLYITVYDGATAEAPELGKGILHIEPADFAKQLTTMKVTNAPNERARLQGLVRFSRFFGGVLWSTYGGVLAPETKLDPQAPPREQRPLKVGAPTLHPFRTSDGVELLLTRYQGGSKGPVVLCHGLGVSSRIFSTDTIETNLLEFLYAQGYDVWLLDFRSSVALPSAAGTYTGDDVATKDYPAAVATVREVTGASTVQMVVHCFGATTFFMAMLAGLQGVRSAVASQIATDFKVGTMTAIKTGLHVPNVLKRLGIKTLTADVEADGPWWEHLYDRALAANALTQAQGRCNNPVCWRITFMYGSLYEHDQLDALTHDQGLSEMFGVGSMVAFEHIALMTRKGHVVSADGKEVYMQHFDRLAIPIRIIQGANNACWKPKSTEITLDRLAKTNGSRLYDRHLVPGYGHIDCMFGRDAARDVFPLVLEHLEATATARQ